MGAAQIELLHLGIGLDLSGLPSLKIVPLCIIVTLSTHA